MFLQRKVEEFLHAYWDQKSPLLLGYSGGPDSKALLYLLLELGVRPHLAHVDHGWREESALEALEIKKEASLLGLPFHETRLPPDRRESAAREMRLSFFTSLFQKFPFQALLLAHQADDWAETALKRVLEGAHLVYLNGMKPVSSWQNTPIWRPLLTAPRQKILDYLDQKKLKALSDPTNQDPTYLRARMRTQILPELARSFGKEISGNLTLLAQRSCELQNYLDEKTAPAIQKIQKGPWGSMLPSQGLHPLEIRHLLQRLRLPLSREMLDGLTDALAQKKANRRFNRRFIADRGYFFHLEENKPPLLELPPLQEGIFHSGNWRIEIFPSSHLHPFHWQDLFLGNATFSLPNNNLNLQKIPAFFRTSIPLCLIKAAPSQGLSIRLSHHSNLFCSV